MSIHHRNNIKITGNGPVTMLFTHGFGSDQHMWRYLAPSFEDRFRTVVFDLVGSGGSDLSAYAYDKYDSLHGYAQDLLEIAEELGDGPIVLVGHSIGATIGLLASIEAPDKFVAHIMVGPSPKYVNDDDYIGGLNADEVAGLLTTIENNYIGWAGTMAPVFMGTPNRPELAVELQDSLQRSNPDIAKHFARVTFLCDHRADLSLSFIPTLVLQCSNDIVVPLSVGRFIESAMPNCTLRVLDNIGHFPHLSTPDATTAAMNEFLAPMTL